MKLDWKNSRNMLKFEKTSFYSLKKAFLENVLKKNWKLSKKIFILQNQLPGQCPSAARAVDSEISKTTARAVPGQLIFGAEIFFLKKLILVAVEGENTKSVLLEI